VKKFYFIILTSLLLLTCGCGFHADKPVEDLIVKYTDNHSRFIKLDGMNVHYRDVGEGPAVLLLHGSNASLHTWQGWADILAADYRVISLDLPGHGLTGPHPKNQYKWQQVAQFINNFVDAISLEKFTIVGNSMGGAIAWHYALQQPEKVSALVLIDSRGIPPQESIPLILRAYSMPVINNLLTVMTPKWTVGLNIKDVYGDPDKVSDEMIDRYFDLTLRAGNRDATVQRMTHPNSYDSTEKLADLKLPTLIMWGEKDSWILPKYASHFKQYMPHAKMITYPELGHIPMEEAPQQTAKDLKAFLQSPLTASLQE